MLFKNRIVQRRGKLENKKSNKNKDFEVIGNKSSPIADEIENFRIEMSNKILDIKEKDFRKFSDRLLDFNQMVNDS